MIAGVRALIFALVLIPTVAWAECAWVLWLGFSQSAEPNFPIPIEAYATQDECRVVLTEKVEGWKRIFEANSGTKVLADDKSVSAYPAQGGLIRVHFVCLPDTIDPRGPKAR